MIATLRNQEGITFYCIHQAVAAVYSARPETRQLMFKRFGFADTGKRFTLNLPDKLIISFMVKPRLKYEDATLAYVSSLPVK